MRLKLCLSLLDADRTIEYAVVADLGDKTALTEKLGELVEKIRGGFPGIASPAQAAKVNVAAPAAAPATLVANGPAPVNGADPGMSQKQRGYLLSLSAKMGLRGSALLAFVRDVVGDPTITIAGLGKAQASAVIEALKAKSAEGEAA